MRRRPPLAALTITMRAVVADPYRGGEALLGRETAARTGAEIDAALSAIPDIHKKRLATLFTLAVSGEDNRLDLMLERDPATLPDIRLSGRNDRIAYRVAHALVPLFGAIELRIDERRTLIDGNEPVEVLLRRRQDEMLEHIEAVQAAFEPIARMFDAGVLAKLEQASERRAKAQRWQKAAGIFAVMAVAAVALLVMWLGKAKTGMPCHANGDCRSSECLPNEVVNATSIGGLVLSMPHPTRSEGVCTSSCATDTDCPAAMKCQEVLQESTLNGKPFPIRSHVLRCATVRDLP